MEEEKETITKFAEEVSESNNEAVPTENVNGSQSTNNVDNKSKDSEESLFSKLIKLYKKNPSLFTSIATTCLWVIGIFIAIIFIAAIVYSIVSAFTLRFGVKEKDLTGDKYKSMTIEQLQGEEFGNCYRSVNNNGWQAFWDEFGDDWASGLNSECEIIEAVDFLIKKYERNNEKYGLKLSPGLVVSTLLNAYSSQSSNDSESVDISQPLLLLEDIAKNNIITTVDLDNIIKNMIINEEYWYYTCEKNTDCEGDGKVCSRIKHKDVYFSREKFEIYLKYGEELSKTYDVLISQIESEKYTCNMCYSIWNTNDVTNSAINIERFQLKANLDTNTADNIAIVFTQEDLNWLDNDQDIKLNLEIGKKYEYKDGYIYTKFPNFKSAFENGTRIEDIYTFKNVDSMVNVIESHEENLNGIYGLSEIVSGSQGKPSTSNITSERDCSEACNCENGNLSPIIGNIETPEDPGITNSDSCNYVLNSSTSMVRLISCRDRDYAYSLSEANKRLPGGAQSNKIKVAGSEVYVAKNAITLEQYIKGVTLTEMGPENNIEALKFQMLMAISNLLYSVNEYSSYTNSMGEIQPEAGICFQGYNQERYDKYYTDGQYKSKIDTAYDTVKGKLLIDSDGSVTNANFVDHFQTVLQEAANKGLTYDKLLTDSNVKADDQYQYYKNSTIQSCDSTSSNLPSADTNLANALIANARKYINKSRVQMASTIKKRIGRTVGPDTSWCAMFVSLILDETLGDKAYLNAQRVDAFYNYYKNKSTFCHAQYWYNEYKTYGCIDSPQPGDIIMFAKATCNYDGKVCPSKVSGGCYRHIGIVTEIKNGEVCYVHGNTSDCGSKCNRNGVAESCTSLNDKYILGYGR